MARILVADDEEDIVRMLTAMLETEGWQIISARNGDEAYERATQDSPDLCVLDNLMPGRTGLEVARELRSNGYAGPIMLFSAYLNRDVSEEARRLEVWPVSKVDISGLVRIARNLLEVS